MKKQLNLKTCLVSSLLVLTITITSLLGTTFAWFTDTVTSSYNRILSGKLDVGMNYWNTDSGKFEDASNVPLFDENALWEPGYVDIAYIEILNLGNLSFNYLFAVYPTEETEGYLKDGSQFWLSDYLVYAVIPYDVEVSGEIATRRQAMDLIGNTKMGLTEESLKYGSMDPTTPAVRLALIVYMPTDVTSDQANHDPSSGKPAPSVKLAVDVYATQKTQEVDSFDNKYDSGLKPSWDVPLWRYAPKGGYTVDSVNKTITVNNVEALKYMGKLFDDMTIHPLYDPSEWEIVLGADMDFAGEVLTAPLRLGGFKSFNGNNKTITNVILNYILVDEEIVSVGLFDELPDTKDLTLENITVNSTTTAAGALAGNLTGDSYQNIKISNASVSGVGYIGGMIGWGNFLHPIDFSGIQIFNPNLSLFGDGAGYAGGIGGYVGGGNKVNVSSSTVSGLNASGVTNAGSYVGGMFGSLDADAEIEESTITEITIYKDVYIGSVTGKIYDEKVVNITKSTVAVQAKNESGSYTVIPLVSDGTVAESEVAVDALGFPQSALHTAYNGHYYQVIQQRVSWYTANDNCIAMNGHLATITSAEENSALARIVRNHGGSTWLGGVRSAEDYSKFVWITGEPMSYTKWASGEPNDLDGEQCIHMYADDGTWNDYDYNTSSATAYACEWDSLQSYLNYLTSK